MLKIKRNSSNTLVILKLFFAFHTDELWLNIGLVHNVIYYTQLYFKTNCREGVNLSVVMPCRDSFECIIYFKISNKQLRFSIERAFERKIVKYTDIIISIIITVSDKFRLNFLNIQKSLVVYNIITSVHRTRTRSTPF